MARSRGKKMSKRRRSPVLTAFAIGAEVRVKAGTADPDYPDIPLGGWAGIVEAVDRKANPPIYLVAWNERTLDQAHPVYHRRCERDGLEAESSWVSETDLEPDLGDLAGIEQPTNLIVRPLRLDEAEDRIREVFGLNHDDPLPAVSTATIRQYHRHLDSRLTLPFAARFTEILADPPKMTEVRVQVIALLDAENADADDGLLCRVIRQEGEADVPLRCLRVEKSPRDRQLITDYANWYYERSEGTVFGDAVWTMPAEPGRKRSRARAWLGGLVVAGFAGAVCGLIVGAVIAAVDGAAIAAGVGTTLLAILGALAGYTSVESTPTGRRAEIEPVPGAILGGTLGALAGALAGAAVVLFVAAIAGALLGGLAATLVAAIWAQVRKRLGWAVLAALCGAVSGSFVQAICRDFGSALEGALYGAGTGAVFTTLVAAAIGGLQTMRSRPGKP